MPQTSLISDIWITIVKQSIMNKGSPGCVIWVLVALGLLITATLWTERNGWAAYMLTMSELGPWKYGKSIVGRYASALAKSGYYDVDLLYLVARDTRPIERLISRAASQTGVPESILEVIAEKESGIEQNVQPRYEDVWEARANKLSQSASEQRMIASSHGPMQVAGWWVEEFNKEDGTSRTWHDLYYRPYNVELGARIFKKCLAGQPSSTDKSRRIWNALRCYNGSGESARAYADNAYSRLGDKLIASLPLN